MQTTTSNSIRRWFLVVEVLFVASAIVIASIGTHGTNSRILGLAGGISVVTFWWGALGLLILSVLLRRSAPSLALLGGITLLAGFIYWFV
jgi:hypothetical protein